MNAHRAKLFFHQNHGHHHHNGKDCIIVVRNSSHKNGHSVFSRYKSADCCRPGWDRRNNADRRCCGIDQICQLGTGNIVLVCDGTHNASHSQTVEIVVYKDNHTEKHGWKQCSSLGFDFSGCPVSVGLGSSWFCNQGYDDSKEYQEEQNIHVVADFPVHDFYHGLGGGKDVEFCKEQRSRQNSDE